MIKRILPFLLAIPLVFSQVNVTATLVTIQEQNITALVPYVYLNATYMTTQEQPTPQLIPYVYLNSTQVTTQEKPVPQLIPYVYISSIYVTTQEKPTPLLIPYIYITSSLYSNQTNQPATVVVLERHITGNATYLKGWIVFKIVDKESPEAYCEIVALTYDGQTSSTTLGFVPTNTEVNKTFGLYLPSKLKEAYILCIADVNIPKAYIFPLIYKYEEYKFLQSASGMVNISQTYLYAEPVTITYYRPDVAIPIIINTKKFIEKGWMRPDCYDIFVTMYDPALNREVIIPYIVDTTTCNTTHTVVWIRIPSNYHYNSIRLFIYFGLVGEEPAVLWNPKETFDLYIDLSNPVDIISYLKILSSGNVTYMIIPQGLYASTSASGALMLQII